MRSYRLLRRGLAGAALATLALPGAALAQDEPSITTVVDELNVTWILVAAVLVMFMQAGFAFLEIGFSRGKNVGMGIAKIVVNFSLGTIAWWACGFALAFGGGGWLFGDSGFFFSSGGTLAGEEIVGSTSAFMLFQFMFCAVSLAIVWGTTLERIKFSAYVIYAIVFAAVIYPLIAHATWGGGFLGDIGGGVQDFAGSTVVHLVGATGGLAALLLLGPRRGKYGPDGKPRAIPGHSMPLVGLGVLILWLGWFGFNGGSTLGTSGSRFAEVMLVTQLGAAAGVIGASLVSYLRFKALDVGMAGNGAIAGLVGITAPSGYVEFWAAPIIGLVAGVLVVLAVLAIEKKLDDPVGALSAHGLAGIWGTLACGLFTSDRLAEANGIGVPGLFYSGSFEQLGVQAVGVGAAFATVFVLSLATFYVIKRTSGLRVSEEAEEAGLDISEHGMYGYPEQFIPEPEYAIGLYEPTVAGTPLPSSSPSRQPAPQTS
ncbi:MAG: ammonium transporter [Solirubrobacteraceae bacterium]